MHAGKIRVHVIGSDLSDRLPNLSEYTKPPSLFLCGSWTTIVIVEISKFKEAML